MPLLVLSVLSFNLNHGFYGLPDYTDYRNNHSYKIRVIF